MLSIPSIIAGVNLKLITVLFKLVQRKEMKEKCRMTRQGGQFQSVTKNPWTTSVCFSVLTFIDEHRKPGFKIKHRG